MDASTLPPAGSTADRHPSDRPRVIVLGGGIAGLAAAQTLARRGYRVTVIDRARELGGTHRSHEIGPYTFDVGSIFYEEDARIFALAADLRAMCPTVLRVQRRIGPGGQLHHYPLEPRDILAWPLPRLARAVASLVLSRLLVRRDGTLDAICRRSLGGTIFTGTGLEHYINRFHHVPATGVDEEFFLHRMGFVARSASLTWIARALWRAVLGKPPRRGPHKPLHVRPPAGFSPFFAAIRRQLEVEGVEFRMGETLTRIEGGRGSFTVTTSAGRHTAEAVVGALPLEVVHQALFGEEPDIKSLDLLTVFVSAGRLDPAAGNVLFNFHRDGRWKRITVYSRIYPDLKTEREFFAAEITLPPGWSPDPEAAFEDLRSHLESVGIAGDLRLEGHALVDHCYPLYTPGSAARRSAVLDRLTGAGLVMIGRQGRFEYLPTSSGVIRRVAEELDRSDLSRADTVPRPRIAPAA